MKLIFLFTLLLSCFAFGAQIKTRTIEWTASTSTDVASHLFYVAKQGVTIDYTTPSVLIAMPTSSYSLPGAFAAYFTTNGSGQYVVGVAAQDSSGNLSDIATSSPIAFDFLPPAPPTAIVVN